MHFRKLRPKYGAGDVDGVEVTIPKSELVQDNVIPDSASSDELKDHLEETQLRFDRLGERTFLVRIDDGRDLPPLESCRPLRQLAASYAMDLDSVVAD